MKKLIVIVNDLERSGKSTLARAISFHLKHQEVDHLLITSDERDLEESFEGDFWDLDEQIDLSELIGAVDRNDAVILDVHTGGARNWADFCEDNDIENLLAELDVEMTLVIPDTGSERCNEEIVDISELFADTADYVIAHLSLEDRTKVAWKKSDAEKATRYLGCVEATLPALPEELITALESSEGELPGVLNRPEDLPRFAEVQICQWLEEFSNSLEVAAEYIVPETIGGVMLDY